jgi:hypothetical protein
LTSLAYFASLVKALRPRCYPIAANTNAGLTYVICQGFAYTRGKSDPERVELGTALVATGYAFAALTDNGQPVHLPYFIAEQDAKRAKVGLWAAPDVPQPTLLLLRASRRTAPARNGSLQGDR